MRTAAACVLWYDKLFATAEAKGRAGEALSAAATVAAGACQRRRRLRPDLRQRLTGCIACMLIGTLLSLMSPALWRNEATRCRLPSSTRSAICSRLALPPSLSAHARSRECLRCSGVPPRSSTTLVGTLLTVLVIRRALSPVFIVLQFVPTWYMLSYIPYGRRASALRRLLRRGGCRWRGGGSSTVRGPFLQPEG